MRTSETKNSIEPIYFLDRKTGRYTSEQVGYILTHDNNRRVMVYGVQGSMPDAGDPKKYEVPSTEDTTRTVIGKPKEIRRWVPEGLVALLKVPFAKAAVDRRVNNSVYKNKRRVHAGIAR